MREQSARHYADDIHVDGNALAGPLSEVFVGDVTVCACRCGACGATEPLARAMVYLNGPGAVVRCASCSAIVLRLTATPSGRWFDLGDGAALCLPAPEGF
ncbi:DUF6510 family protein [Nocardia bovistercoris]|uniref:Uncharacterized protein n=1 Tax=Nocardia bovistercoris TaxID=2785916 RepID=A0A931IB37_9NOCA|nr:DUF6510 family protein [Nocardia bovistercoris]MBH0776942.1 hypothetical protein [Nocardia bovistercoris]